MMAPRKDDSKMCRLTCSLKATYHRVRKQLSWNGLIVSVLIAVVWCLLSLPIIFYHYRPEDATNDGSPSCEPYIGQVCTPVLDGFHKCFHQESGSVSPNSGTVASVRSADQRRAELLIKTLLSSFNILPQSNVSAECKVAAYLFSCRYFLPQCVVVNGTEQVWLPSSRQCGQMLALCREPLSMLLGSRPELAGYLPDCNLLPNRTSAPTCTDYIRANISSSGPLQLDITCRSGFSLENGYCVARCDSWEQSSHAKIVTVKVANILASIIAIIGGTVLVVVSFFRRKTMFGFPSAFIVYQTLSCCSVAVLLLINNSNHDGFFCDEEYVQDALEKATPFCTISGVGRQYFVLSFSVWWFIHVCCLFWKVVFPVHARGYRRHYKHIHIVLIAVGLMLPIPGVIAAFATGGYAINQFPALLCGLKDQDTEYYSLWLAMNLLQVAGITMLIVLAYKVHKHQGLFGQNAKNAKHALNKAERKLIIIFTYYMVFATLTLVYYSIVTGNYDNFEEAVIDYFSCEAGGYNPVSPCPKDYEQYTYPELQATIYIVMGFIPSVNLIYVIDVQRMRKEVTEWFPSLSHALSKSNLDSSPNRAKSNLSSFAESKNFVSIVT